MGNSSRKIYTRRGDEGLTQLLSKETVDKGDKRVEAFGTLDELQSHLGLARALTCQESIRSILYYIQEDLFVAGAELASTSKALSDLKQRISKSNTEKLEGWIDKFTSLYGLPKDFVVPGKYLDSSALHVARSVCRRAERLIVILNREERVYGDLIRFFNRLSDLLFVLAWSLEVNALIEDIVREVIESAIKEDKT
jgi:ATP:cob(I)alamin adenosyltransferase